MKQKLKRFMAGFMAMLTLVGTLFTNGTTAFAASPQANIAFWNASVKNSGEVSELKPGYNHGKILYSILDGNSAYCMNFGLRADGGQLMNSYDDASTSMSAQQRKLLSYCLYYGFNSTQKAAPSNSQRDEYIATQAMVWVIVADIFGTGSGDSAARKLCNTAPSPDSSYSYYERLRDNISSSYNATLPSFASRRTSEAPTYELKWNEGSQRFETTLSDSNGVLSDFDFGISGYSVDKNGNSITISSTSVNTTATSIVDVSQLQCMLDKAKAYGYKNAGFILDRGYFSRENIKYMDKCGYDFVIMIKGMKALVNDAVKEVKGTFEDSRQYTIRRFGVNGTTVERTVFPSDERNRYLHIYYSYSKAAAEREQLEQKIDKLAAYFKKLEGQPVVLDKSYEKYFSLEYYHEGQEDQCFVCAIEKSSVIEEELKMCGYFCIITSENMKAKEALELYKSRDVSEKLFKADKTFLGNRSMRVYTGDALEGKMLIAFVALIIRNRMYTKLKDEEEKLLSSPNFMNVPAAIRELEKIEMIRQADGVYRLDHAVTANQKIILKAFGIDANYIKRKAEQISNELNPKVLKVKINGRKS